MGSLNDLVVIEVVVAAEDYVDEAGGRFLC